MEEDFTVQRLYKQNKLQQKKIKQLEAENTDIHKEYADLASMNLSLGAENEKLKEALEYIASCTSSWEDYVETILQSLK